MKFDFFELDLNPEEELVLLQKAATAVKRRKMEVPAIALLESHKPLAGLVSGGAALWAPFLIPIFGFDNVNNYGQVLSKRDNIEILLEMLEKKDEEMPEFTEEQCPAP